MCFLTKTETCSNKSYACKFTGYYGYLQPNKLNIVNFQELLMLINVTIMYVVSIQDDEKIFSVITNVMMSLALIQFTIIVLSHFFVYTCQCNNINLTLKRN